MIKKRKPREKSFGFCFFLFYIKEATVSTNSTTFSPAFFIVFLAEELLVFIPPIIAAAEQTASVAPIIFIIFVDVFLLIFIT